MSASPMVKILCFHEKSIKNPEKSFCSEKILYTFSNADACKGLAFDFQRRKSCTIPARSETRAARATRATRANIFIAKTMSDNIVSTFLRHRRHKYPLLLKNRALFRVYPSRPSFRSAPIRKNENMGDSGKMQKNHQASQFKHSPREETFAMLVDSYYILPSTQRRINTSIQNWNPYRGCKTGHAD